MSFEHPADYLRNAPYHDPTTILVLVVMGQGADSKTGLMWRYIDTLAEECRISQRSVRRILRKLIADGFVERQPRYRADGSQRSNMWRMFFTAEAALRKAGQAIPFPPDADIDDLSDAEEVSPMTGGGVTHDRGGVSPMTGGGVTHDRGGVSPMTPLVKTLLKDPCKDSIETPSLARSADHSSPRETAPAARGEMFDASALRRDPLTLTLIACLGYEPATRREWGQWRIAVNDLRACGVTSDDIPRAIRGYQATYPRARVTPLALVGHWAEIQKGKPHDLAQLEINRRAATADQQLQAERERADAERRAQEEREVKQLLAEYGYADGR